MKENIVALYFVLFALSSFAQFDAFESEVSINNNIVYFHNKAFTGTLYSDDEIEIPNECACTSMTRYKNGVINGKKLKWDTNGNKLLEENYFVGVLNGKRIQYKDNKIVLLQDYKNGNLIKEKTFDKNESLKNEFNYKDNKKHGVQRYFNNGVLVKEEVFDNGTIQNQKIYENKRLYKETQYGDNLQTVITYNKNGTKASEYSYQNNKLIAGGKYDNNKKHGKWITYINNFLTKIEKNYKNGVVIDSTVIDTHRYIKNNIPPSNKNEFIIVYNNELNAQKKYFYVKFSNTFYKQNKILAEKLVEIITARAKKIRNYQSHEENELNYFLSFDNYTNNNGSIQFDISFSDFDKTSIQILNFKGHPPDFSTPDWTKTFVNNKNKQYLSEFISEILPIQAKLISVRKQTETEILYIVINKGKNDGIYKKMKLYVLDSANNLTMSEVKVLSVKANEAICKVYSYTEWLKKYNQNNPVILTEKTKLN